MKTNDDILSAVVVLLLLKVGEFGEVDLLLKSMLLIAELRNELTLLLGQHQFGVDTGLDVLDLGDDGFDPVLGDVSLPGVLQ